MKLPQPTFLGSSRPLRLNHFKPADDHNDPRLKAILSGIAPKVRHDVRLRSLLGNCLPASVSIGAPCLIGHKLGLSNEEVVSIFNRVGPYRHALALGMYPTAMTLHCRGNDGKEQRLFTDDSNPERHYYFLDIQFNQPTLLGHDSIVRDGLLLGKGEAPLDDKKALNLASYLVDLNMGRSFLRDVDRDSDHLLRRLTRSVAGEREKGEAYSLLDLQRALTELVQGQVWSITLLAAGFVLHAVDEDGGISRTSWMFNIPVVRDL